LTADIIDYVYNPVFWVILNVVLVILIAAIIYNISRMKSSIPSPRMEDSEYMELLRSIQSVPPDPKRMIAIVNRFLGYACQRLRIDPAPGATLREVMKLISNAVPESGEVMARLGRIYEPIRYGGKEPTEEDASSLRSILLEGVEVIRRRVEKPDLRGRS